MNSMTKKQRRHTPEQIIGKLAEGHKPMVGGMTIEETCRQFGIAESSWHRWLSQYGGMKAEGLWDPHRSRQHVAGWSHAAGVGIQGDGTIDDRNVSAVVQVRLCSPT